MYINSCRIVSNIDELCKLKLCTSLDNLVNLVEEEPPRHLSREILSGEEKLIVYFDENGLYYGWDRWSDYLNGRIVGDRLRLIIRNANGNNLLIE